MSNETFYLNTPEKAASVGWHRVLEYVFGDPALPFVKHDLDAGTFTYIDLSKEELESILDKVLNEGEFDVHPREIDMYNDFANYYNKKYIDCEEHTWVELVDEDGQLVEPAQDVCVSCGKTR